MLVAQCARLAQYAESMQTWRQCPYTTFIHIATEQTLNELRRHWILYTGVLELPAAKLTQMRNDLKKVFERAKNFGDGVSFGTARSAGPLMQTAVPKISDCVNHYQKTGLTFTHPKLIQQAKFMNPTFLYSRAGDLCSVHYGTDPFFPFHLAPLFGSTTGIIKTEDVVKAVQEEFFQWCSAFKKAISLTSTSIPTMRIFWGEATAVSRTLQSFAIARVHSVGMPVSQFTTQVIHLDKVEYSDGPITFNVIDTSNLVDYMGLLNVIITSSPLLDLSSPSHVLYTESLLFKTQEGRKEFKDRLHTDLTLASHLIGLSPVDYLSGFNSRSNTHEVMLYELAKADGMQFHQMTTWKAPASADPHAVLTDTHQNPVIFDTFQLATVLWDVYVSLFFQEDSRNFFNANQGEGLVRAIGASNILHASRESFVLFMRMVRERNHIPEGEWAAVMTRFMFLQEADRSMPMDKNNTQDLMLHLHRYGIHALSPAFTFAPDAMKKTGRFSNWKTVPPLVRIILRVPREKLAILDEMKDESNPILHCDLGGQRSHNMYSSIHLAYGEVTSLGTEDNPRARFDPDPKGPQGSMPLVVSFIAPSATLYALESPENMEVNLRVRSTPGTVPYIRRIGISLSLFSAKVMNTKSVLVLPETTIPARHFDTYSLSVLPDNHRARQDIGTCDPTYVYLEGECELIQTVVARVRINNAEVKRTFGQENAMPQICQIASCTMRLSIGHAVQDVSFTFPVQGSKNRLRLARKSLYIEIVVPVYEPFKSKGMRMNLFPIIPSRAQQGNLSSWSIHHLNLAKLPSIDIRSSTSRPMWVDMHVGSMFSHRERSLRKKQSTSDQLTLLKDTLHAIMVNATGVQGKAPLAKRQVFSLFNTDAKNADTIIFISDAKYDLSSHTVVLDAFVYPGTVSLTGKLLFSIGKLFEKGNVNQIPVRQEEVQAYKQLLPSLAERCRTGSWTHEPNCEYQTQGRIPLSTEMEHDPLCSCGQGKDVEPMKNNKLWAPFAPYVTRIAISPLFGVSYLEAILRDPSQKKCFVCRKSRKPNLLECMKCKNVRYCSQDCQKKDWPTHKPRCKKAT